MEKKISERKRPKVTGRGAPMQYLGLPHSLVRSAEWRGLSGNTVKFLIELASGFNGRNNGDLSLTRREAMDRGWHSKGTRDRAEQEALEAGFILVSRPGHRNACTLYAVTWLPIDDVGKGTVLKSTATAPNTWRQRGPITGHRVALKQGHEL